MKNRNQNTHLLFLGLAAICIVAGISCSGDGEGLTKTGDLPADLPASGLDLIQPIFDAYCVRCHVTGGSGYSQTGGDDDDGLDLTSGASFATLVNRPTFQRPSEPPRWRVLPGEPDSSYLMDKIRADSPKSGSRMPQNGPPFLSQADIELIRRWIEDGAPRE